METREVDYLNKTGDVIPGKQMNLEILGATSINICDSLLLVTTSNPNGMLEVLSLSDLEPLATLCTQGRAHNEFTRQAVNYTKQFYHRNGDIILPLCDEYSAAMKEINISESLRQGKTITEGQSENPSILGFNNITLGNDISNRFILKDEWGQTFDGIAMMFCMVNQANDTTVIPVYDGAFDDILGLNNIAGVMHRHPEKNLVCYPLACLDYIFFIDTDTGENFAIHQQGSAIINEFDHNGQDYRNTFGMAAVTSNFILVLYTAGDYTLNTAKANDTDEETPIPELLAFNWNGNYLGGVKLGEVIGDIAFDEEHNILYGLNPVLETFYSFNLSEFISSIKQ